MNEFFRHDCEWMKRWLCVWGNWGGSTRSLAGVQESVNEQIAQALKKSVMQLRVCLSRCVTALSVIAERQSTIVVLKNKNLNSVTAVQNYRQFTRYLSVFFHLRRPYLNRLLPTPVHVSFLQEFLPFFHIVDDKPCFSPGGCWSVPCQSLTKNNCVKLGN